LLVLVAREASQLGADTLFLYTTGQAQVIQGEYVPLRSTRIVAEAARQAGVPWVDTAERMHQRLDRFELYYPKDGHWTEKGHRAVTEIVMDEISRLGLLSRGPGD
jgi:hypothetical protein